MKIQDKVRKSENSRKDIVFDNKKVSPIPDQHKSSDKFIRQHGCSIAAMYIMLRYFGKEWSLKKCKNYMAKHYSLHGHSKYSIRQVADAIDKIVGKDAVKYVKSATEAEIKAALKNGKPIIFEEKDPVHTVVIVQNLKRQSTNRTVRLSGGGVQWRTLKHFLKKKCTSDYYKGYVFIK